MSFIIQVLWNLLRKPFTRRYPKEKPVLPDGYRGTLTVSRDKCVSCGTCVKYCPAYCMKLVEGRLEIDLGECISCGLCVLKCPQGALEFSKEFENATKDKKDLISR